MTPGVACTALSLLLCACGGGSGENPSPRPPPAVNVAPTANAGVSQSTSSGVTVTLNGSSSTDSDGTIASYAWTQTAGSPTVALSSASIAQPSFAAPQVAAAATFTFSLIVTDNLGAASQPSTVTITVNPPIAGNTNVTGRITFGRVPFATAAPNGLNYGSPAQQPSRGVTVRAVAPGTTAPALATTTTNANGDYTLSVASNTSVQILIVAEMVRTGAAPTWNVRVADGNTNDPVATPTYTYTDGVTFNTSAGTPRDIAIPTGINSSGTATGTRASGPFAALDTIYQGIQTILGVEPAAIFPALLVDWGTQANGTFFDSNPPQRIALLADLTADTDEFDQHVVAHEFGHYIEQNFSRADNIGGAHAVGEKLDPRVAFGEGFGYAFAAIVLNDPIARDSFTDPAMTRCGQRLCSGSFNVETNPPRTSAGASPATNFGCWCSESSVWSILWDLHDTVADANDTVALGFAPLWQVLTEEQRTTPAFTTLFSFVAALKTGRSAGEVSAINTLVTAQNVVSSTIDAFATTETNANVPTPFLPADILPVYSTITAGGPAVPVRSVNDAGATYNKLGNRHFLRFTANASGNVTVTVTTSNATADADPDFIVWRAGSVATIGQDFGPSEQEVFPVVAGQTYIIDAYECTNGCDSDQGTPTGDYTLTVTVN
jgi:hypothetical protein